MERDLQRLNSLQNDGFKLIEIHFSFDKTKNPQELIELTMKKGNEVTVISSSENELISYAIHLHSMPHIEDEGSDFIFLEDPNRYFAIQKEIIDLFSGKKEFIIYETKLNWSQERIRKITTFQRNWIISEKDTKMGNTKLSQIFYDVGILHLRGEEYEFKILPKEKISIGEIKDLLSESQKSDLSICFSAFVGGPNISSRKEELNDAIVGIIVYDLKNRQTLSFNINSLRQFERKVKDVGKYGLWECVFDLFEKTEHDHSFRSYLPLPLNVRDFTPLPWFCYAFIKGLKEEAIFENVHLDLPLFVIFGTPLVLQNKSSYCFYADRQVALLMLEFSANDKKFIHQVRFDISKGEPKLHIDYEVFPPNEKSYKIIGHSIVDYKEIWDFSENLAIGFLMASAYDINFEKIVVPSGLSGIDDAFRNNPLTVCPLFVRSMVNIPLKVVRGDLSLKIAIFDIAQSKGTINQADKRKLEELGLLWDNGLSILGDIVYARLLQIEKKEIH